MEVKSKACYLALGSNLGDSEQMFEDCYALLEQTAGTVVQKSSNYWTEPEGLESDRPFLNACCLVHTKLSAKELLIVTQQIEKELGRKTKSSGSYESRLIDIDILTYGHEEWNEKELIIPHPEFHKRLFVLVPLQELTSVIEVSNNKFYLEELINKIDGITYPKRDLREI